MSSGRSPYTTRSRARARLQQQTNPPGSGLAVATGAALSGRDAAVLLVLLALRPLQVEEKHGMIFVMPNPDLSFDIDEVLAGIEEMPVRLVSTLAIMFVRMIALLERRSRHSLCHDSLHQLGFLRVRHQ